MLWHGARLLFYFMGHDDTGFSPPPGAGTNGVPLKQLFGFERVHLKPGETKSVYLYPDLKEFTQVGPDGHREALAGSYLVSFGLSETAELGMGYTTHSFSAI